ncbi:DUF3558 domain-containing protein [Lentzea sp. PSKA42]|jgi:hypothetical protein|uniref:DUF3558 domain-containing protein n=1 Tax=Lentzea indica TaxID=2604800 RepID=A0ABX1FAY2_9PSEU|nr:DUF3558 domain-containing protein [Lentzea indica]NKE55861.1 DUF3558 domain-containing protein [Lentzea indica]
MRRLAVPFLLAAVLTGCSSTEPGSPSAGNQNSPAPTTGTSAGTAPVNRPKAVDMKTLDPCSLITPEVKTALGIRLVNPREPLAEYGEGSKTCSNNYEDRTYSSSIYTLVNGGVDRLKRTVGEAKLTSLQIAGYPGYLTQREAVGGGPGCEVYLDANDGQLLLVNAIAGLGGDKATMDGACEKAKALANAVGAVLATK